jgi:hypothetical protein
LKTLEQILCVKNVKRLSSTEMKIVEKLEQSRMEDEKRRAGVLFGDKFDNLNNPGATQAVAPQVVAPVQTQPALDIRGELRAVLDEQNAAKAVVPVKRKSYFGLGLGMGEYPSAVNMRGNYALSASLGQYISDKAVFEGTFNYSNFEVEKVIGAINPYTPEITNLDQYSASGLIKLSLLTGSFKPQIGALAAYTYRNYTDTQYYFNSNEATSHSIDVGLMTGADIEFSEEYSLGIDFRYLWNLTNRVNSGSNSTIQQSLFQSSASQTYGGTPVEDLSYYMLSVVGKMTF